MDALPTPRTCPGTCSRVPAAGASRVSILQAIDERPRNANQLAAAVDRNFTTVRNHPERLESNTVVPAGGDGYGAVWLRNYLEYGARHTLSLLIFAAILTVQNLRWVYCYTFQAGYLDWYGATSTDVQVGMVALCGLEFFGLAVLASFTLR